MTNHEPQIVPNEPPTLHELEAMPTEQQPLGTLIDGTELFLKKAFDDSPELGATLLFKAYYQALCTHAVRYVYSKEVAEDLVCDVFYSFWNTKAYQTISSSYRAYLFRSVRNRAFNYLAYELKKNDSIDIAIHHEAASSDLPQQMMQFEELYHQIDSIVETLPKQCQRIFLMNRFEGKKPKEIAQDLQISVRTVETHIQKALNTLKSKLKSSFIISLLLVFCS
jgi:RNA polymerase sigma-70 factor (family 1)